MSERPSAACFPTTSWGRILEAGDPAAPESRAALEELCRDYWYPLYAFARRKGDDPETAQDLVQGLFASLLERDELRGLEPDRGRFPRSFLMACCRTITCPDTMSVSGPPGGGRAEPASRSMPSRRKLALASKGEAMNSPPSDYSSADGP